VALTDTQIRNAKPKARRYRIADAHGLSVEISPRKDKDGRKQVGRHWRYRYRLNGKENLFAAGEWCTAPAGETPEQARERQEAGRLTLAEARVARLTWRAQVKAGQHPRVARAAQALTKAASNAETFDAVAAEYIKKRGGTWSDQHRKRIERFLERDISPDIGALPMRSVLTSHLLPLLRRVEERGAHSIAALGRGYLGAIFRYGIASGKADLDPAAGLARALEKPATQHHQPLEPTDIAPFFEKLDSDGGNRPTIIAVRLMAYTFARTVELRGAPWTEFDLDGADWRLPAQRMKMRRPHIVPLSRQAVELLEELRELTGRQKWLFPNVRRPAQFMGATTLNRVIDRLGYLDRFTAHGFRATASTMLHEAGVDTRLIEIQLAHQDRNKSRASYDHSARLPERREMMQHWADMLDGMAKAKKNVVPIRSARRAS
jgi:integrase